MEDLTPILQVLVDADFFSPTKSRMAKELGRKDKQIFYGRMAATAEDGKQVLGSAALEALCKDICRAYNISEYTLAHLLDIWNMAHALAGQCRPEDLLALVRKRFSVVKDSELRSTLRSLAKDSAIDYCNVLALYYALALGIDANARKSSDIFIEVVQNVDAILRKSYPENISAHQIAMDYIDQARSIKIMGWCLLMSFVGRLICVYSNPLYLETVASSNFVTLPIGEESWWMDVDSDEQSEQATLYYLFQTAEDSGIYGVLEVKADRNREIDPSQCTYYRWGFIRDYDVLRCVQPHGQKVLAWGYYDFEYEGTEDWQAIRTRPQEVLNGKHKIIPLPECLVRIPNDSPWGKWINHLEEDAALNILEALDIEAMGLEATDYEVTDVIMSRNKCRLCYASGDPEKNHPTPTSTATPRKVATLRTEVAEFSLEQYPSLKKVTVWDEVYIFRSPADQSLYAHWPELGLLITMR